MKLPAALLLCTAVLLAGCGPSPEERAERAKEGAAEIMRKYHQRAAEKEEKERKAAEAEAEAARKAEEERRDRAIEGLLEICEDATRDRLKDPDSLRRLGNVYRAKAYEEVQPAPRFSDGSTMWGNYDATLSFDYTATNSYGGRLRGESLCVFLNKSLIYQTEVDE